MNRPVIFVLGWLMTCSAYAEQSQVTPAHNEILPATTEISAKSVVIVEKVSAVVQFAKGKAEVTNAQGEIKNAVFKMPVYEEERLRVYSGLLKIRTREDCTAVFYDGNKAREHKGVWQVMGTAVRWLCPDGQSQQILLNGAKLSLGSGSEILYSQKHILLLRGSVSYGEKSEPLSPLQIYEFSSQALKPPAQISTVDEIWKFNQQESPPKESFALAAPAAVIPTWRVILSPSFGKGKIWHDNSSLNGGQADINSGTLQVHHQHGDHSWIGVLKYSELQDGKQNQQDTNNGQGNGFTGSSNDMKNFSVEGGVRLWHDKWWSPYARLGLGYETDRLSVNRPDLSYFASADYRYLSLLGASGIDAFYSPWSRGLGIYAGIEAQITRSLFCMGSSDNSSSLNGTGSGASESQNQSGPITTLAISISAGLSLGF